MPRPLRRLLCCLLLWPGLVWSAAEPTRVTLQLKWQHQFQFAGYYAAKEKGFYRAAGLDVDIREALPGQEVIPTVVSGAADFGVGTNDLLLARYKGEPVVALAVIFQHSPSCILAARDKGIRSLADLAGHTVQYEPNFTELLAFFKRAGVDVTRLRLAPYAMDLAMFEQGKVDALAAYITNEPYGLIQRGFPFLEFRPISAGIDFYGDNLFTTDRMARESPALVAAFRAASLKGWRYAMAHQEEIIELILKKYRARRTHSHLAWEAGRINELMMPELVEIGYMSPTRWRHIADTYAEMGFLPPGYDFSRMLYSPEGHPDLQHLYGWLAGAAALLVAMAGIIVFILDSRRRLGESQERYERTVATVPGVLFDFIRHADNREEIVYISPRCREILDLDEEALITDPGRIFRLVHPDDRAAFLQAREHARQNQSEFLAEARLCLPSGRTRWIQFSARANPSKSGADIYWSGILLDVTQRHEAESARRDSEDRFRTLVNAMGEGVVRVDADGLIMDCNPAAERILGRPRDVLIGHSTRSEDWITHHPDGSVFAPEDYPISHTLRTGESQRGVVLGLTDPDGVQRWLSISTDPIRRDQDDTIAGAVVTFADVTEVRAAEILLKASEGRFRTLFENAPIAYQSLDAEGHFLDVNDPLCVLLGCGRADLLGRSFGDFWAPGQDFGAAFAKLKENCAARVEIALNRADGEPVTVLLEGRVQRDTKGAFVRTHCVLFDISERKRMETALRGSEALLRGILDASDEGVLVVGQNRRVLAVNHRFNEIWRFPPGFESADDEERLAYVVEQLVDPERFLAQVLALYQDDEEREDALHLKDGRVLFRFTRMLKVAGISARIWTFRDMTQLLESQREIRDERARLRTLLETLPEPIWLKDPDGVYLACNPAFEKVYNLRESELVGKTDADFTDAESARFLRAKDQEAILADRTIVSEEWVTYAATGERILLAKVKTPMRDGDGRLVGVLGIGRDVTEERQIQEVLGAAKSQAEAANRAKSQFLSRMSHELRTPLNAIIGFSELLQLDMDNPLTGQQQEFLGHILNGASHLLALINEVLDLSRIETGRMELSMEAVYLPDLLSECMELTRPLAANRNIRLGVENHACQLIHADPVRLRQVLLNLLSNAVKYNREGGSVTVLCEETREGKVRISVSDTGPGIPEERRAEVFQPFQRLGAEHTAVEGTGIGLTISKRLVEAMGGEIGFRNGKDQGTTFWVEMPAAELPA